MTTHQLDRLLNHPIINAKGLCDEAGVSYSMMWQGIQNDRPLTTEESQKIEAYLSKWGIEWRDLIKEGLCHK